MKDREDVAEGEYREMKRHGHFDETNWVDVLDDQFGSDGGTITVII